MPLIGGKSSFLQPSTKTWRPKSTEQQFLESQRKRLVEEEQLKKAEVSERIKTLEQVAKLEAKTQQLNEMALAAELKAKEHELALRERQVSEAKHLELAKLDLAKRIGRESLSEADLARIRNERLRTEALARAAKDHALRENRRPIPPVHIGPAHTSLPLPPPPPVPHPLPPPVRPLSSQSVRRGIPGPSYRATPAPMMNASTTRLEPPGATTRMRRMSDSLARPPAGIQRGLGPAPYPTRHLRSQSGNISAEMTLRAHAERLRRRRLEALDHKARQHDLQVQALRGLRKRELAAELRERGIQQREIEAQVARLAERDRTLNEAQLREIRDREHRIRLKEKGLQEREILDQIRRRQENDREALRQELDLVERQLQRKELLDAELAIKRAMEKGESPPMGIARPSMEEIETEGLLNDLYDDLDISSPYLRHDHFSENGYSLDYRPRSTGVGQTSASLGSRNPNTNHLSRTPSVGHRTPHLHPTSAAHHPMTSPIHDRIREEQMRLNDEIQMRSDLLNAASSRAPTPRIRDGLSRQATPQSHLSALDNSRLNAGGRATPYSATPRTQGEQFLGDNLLRTPARSRSQSFDQPRLSKAALNAGIRDASRSRPNSPSMLTRQDIADIARAESRATAREELETRERAETKLSQRQRLEDMMAREEQNRLNAISQDVYMPTMHHLLRTPSVRDGLEPNRYADNHHLDKQPRSSSRASSRGRNHLDIPVRPSSRASIREPDHLGLPVRSSSRASSRAHDFDSISRPGSRASCIRYDHSPTEPRLGLPSRPSSRNLTAEDLGLRFGSEPMDRVPVMHAPHPDDVLDSRLASAAANSEINGGRRSRANSRVGLMDERYRHDEHRLLADMNAMGLNEGRSHANSHADNDFVNDPAGRRSRSTSHAMMPNVDLSPNPRRDHLGDEFANGRRSRASSITATHHVHSDELNSNLIGTSRSPVGYGGEPGLSTLTNAELSQLSTEQLESMLLAPSNMTGLRRDDDMYEEGNLYSGMPISEVGGGTSHSLDRRGSGLDIDNSPPFGHSAYSHSPIEPPRPMSRAGITNGRESGHYYDRQHASRDEYSASREERLLDSGAYDSSGDGDFSITEMPEQPGARITRRFGAVEASSHSPRSAMLASQYDGLNNRDDMHRAVEQLIRVASQRGANGIVSLRVSDAPDGSYIATGEAVFLEEYN